MAPVSRLALIFPSLRGPVMHGMGTALRQQRRFSFRHSVPAGNLRTVMHMALILSGHEKGRVVLFEPASCLSRQARRQTHSASHYIHRSSHHPADQLQECRRPSPPWLSAILLPPGLQHWTTCERGIAADLDGISLVPPPVSECTSASIQNRFGLLVHETD